MNPQSTIPRSPRSNKPPTTTTTTTTVHELHQHSIDQEDNQEQEDQQPPSKKAKFDHSNSSSPPQQQESPQPQQQQKQGHDTNPNKEGSSTSEPHSSPIIRSDVIKYYQLGSTAFHQVFANCVISKTTTKDSLISLTSGILEHLGTMSVRFFLLCFPQNQSLTLSLLCVFSQNGCRDSLL
jgi:hypothetical protein